MKIQRLLITVVLSLSCFNILVVIKKPSDIISFVVQDMPSVLSHIVNTDGVQHS